MLTAAMIGHVTICEVQRECRAESDLPKVKSEYVVASGKQGWIYAKAEEQETNNSKWKHLQQHVVAQRVVAHATF